MGKFPKMPKNKVPVSVSIPFDELAEIDETVYSLGLTRSDFILQSVREKMIKLQKQK